MGNEIEKIEDLLEDLLKDLINGRKMFNENLHFKASVLSILYGCNPIQVLADVHRSNKILSNEIEELLEQQSLNRVIKQNKYHMVTYKVPSKNDEQIFQTCLTDMKPIQLMSFLQQKDEIKVQQYGDYCLLYSSEISESEFNEHKQNFKIWKSERNVTK
jgi:UDP-N-acetylglucosamine 2-epimerase